MSDIEALKKVIISKYHSKDRAEREEAFELLVEISERDVLLLMLDFLRYV